MKIENSGMIATMTPITTYSSKLPLRRPPRALMAISDTRACLASGPGQNNRQRRGFFRRGGASGDFVSTQLHGPCSTGDRSEVFDIAVDADDLPGDVTRQIRGEKQR